MLGIPKVVAVEEIPKPNLNSVETAEVCLKARPNFTTKQFTTPSYEKRHWTGHQTAEQWVGHELLGADRWPAGHLAQRGPSEVQPAGGGTALLEAPAPTRNFEFYLGEELSEIRDWNFHQRIPLALEPSRPPQLNSAHNERRHTNS